MTATDDVEYVDFDEIAGDVADLLEVVGYGTDHIGAMLALVPADAQDLAVDVADGDPPSQLHVTLGYLAASALTIDAEQAAQAAMRAAVAAVSGPVTATVTSIGELGDEGAVVLFLEPTAELTAIHDAVWAVLDRSGVEFRENFSPWKPHLTLGYAPTDAGRVDLTAAGQPMVGSTVRFDQVTLVNAGAWTYEALGRPGLAAATHRAGLYAEFANPYHDERGRFARKDGGRAVPTKGLESTGRVDLTKLDPKDATVARLDLFPDDDLGDGTVYPPVRLGPVLTVGSDGGVLRDVEWNGGNAIGTGRYVYISDRGATRVKVDGTWSRDRAMPFIEVSHAIDPSVSIAFTRSGVTGSGDVGMLAWVDIPNGDPASGGVRPTVFVSDWSRMLPDWGGWVRENPDHFMPAAQKVSQAEYVMTHEHGHLAHFKNTKYDMGFPSHKGVVKIKQKLLSKIREHKVAEQPSGGWTIDDLKPVREDLGLSVYGMTKPIEAVAEAWTQRRLDPGNLSPECRQILKAAGL